MVFVDREGNPVNIDYEKEERFLIRTYLPKNACVLELGARYGTVSCVISEVLEDPTKHVAVEPDSSVIETLTKNRGENGGKFHIFNGVVSEHGYELKFIDPKFDFAPSPVFFTRDFYLTTMKKIQRFAMFLEKDLRSIVK